MAKVIVTGCGGFLGSEIVRQLLDRGDQVVGISRGHYPALVERGMIAKVGDLCDRDFVNASIRDADAVIHTAAKAGVWGRWDEYHTINTLATKWIVQACENQSLAAMVHTSSPSVTFDGDHQRGVDESEPYPERFLCAYPHTKMLAERLVLAADRPGQFRTAALRPHLIWGHGDPHLLPRVLEKSRSGKLRIVGDGNNLVDMVHVTNAAMCHLNALDVLLGDPDRAGGRAYFVTDDAPLKCWQWIADVCQMHGVTPPRKTISYAAASAAGAMMEMAYRLTKRTAEPPMTRFVAAQLARDHYFDISAAKDRLGYRIVTPPVQGMEEIARMFAQTGANG